MKATNILTITFIFALSVNSFATDKSDNTFNSIEANPNSIGSVRIQNGRNNNVKSDPVAIENNRQNIPFYTNTGRNKYTINEFISMN